MSCNHLETYTLRRGDSSDFFYHITVNINFEEGSTIDLEGWKARLRIGNFEQIYTDLTSKELEIILTSEDTKNLAVGTYTAYLQFETSDNKVGTMKPLFKFEIIEEVI